MKPLEAGKTYLIQIWINYASTTYSYNMIYCRTTSNVESLPYTGRYVSGIFNETTRDWTFTANATGTYDFYTTGSSDTYGTLLSSSNSQLIYDDDSGDNNNFKFSYRCIAGRTYTIRVRMSSSSSTLRSFVLNVVPKKIESCDHGRLVNHPAVTPTCNVQGNTEYNHCQDCGGYFDAEMNSITQDSWVLPTVARTGSCGANVTWTLRDYTLTISGTGPMNNYHKVSEQVGYTWRTYGDMPWYGISYNNVVVSEGVTSIGSYAFYESNITSCSLPSTLTKIAPYAFSYSTVTSIIIPDQVTEIEASTFLNCSKLTSITIPSSVTHFSANAFQGCNEVTAVYYNAPYACYWSTITFDNQYANPMAASGKAFLYIGNTKSLMTNLVLHANAVSYHVCHGNISPYAFYNCQNRFTLVTEGGYTGQTIGAYAFYNCVNMIQANVVSSIRTVGAYAFYECKSITSWYELFKGLTSVGTHAFDGCTGLTSLTVPAGCQYTEYSFANTGIKTLYFAEGITEIPRYAFYGSKSLTTLSLSNTVETIGYGAFDYCTALQKLTLPESVKTIKGSAFAHCNNLYFLYLPTTLETIESYAFEYCYKLNSLTFYGRGPSIGTGAFSGSTATTVTYFKGSSWTGKINNYGGKLTWVPYGGSCGSNAKWTLDENGVLEITGTGSVSAASWANKYHDIQSLVISEGIDTISANAFSNITTLKSVTLPSTLANYGNAAFSGCSLLNEVRITDLAAWVEASRNDLSGAPNLNAGCRLILNGEELTAVTLPAGITRIGSYAFANFTGITEVTMSENVTTIGSKVFDGCTNTEVILSDGITSIASDAFSTTDPVKKLIAHAGTATARALYTTDVKSFSDPNAPDFLLWDSGKHVGVAAYTGRIDRVTIPAFINEWVMPELFIQELILPASLKETDTISLKAARVYVSDDVTKLAGVTLTGVNKIRLPRSVSFDDLEALTLNECLPTVYCYMDTDAEIWAMVYGNPIIYLEETLWDPVLTHVGGAIALDVGESFTFNSDDFWIDPVPDFYTGILTLTGEGLSVNGLTITPNQAGDLTITAEMDLATCEIPVHVYAPVESMTLECGDIAVKGSEILATLTDLAPDDIRMQFTWTQDDVVIYSGSETAHAFTAPADREQTVITVTASSGMTKSAGVTIPQTLTYNGSAITLELHESYEFTDEQFTLSPVTADADVQISLSSAGLTVQGMKVIPVKPGDYTVTAEAYACTVQIPVHIYAPVSDFTLSAPVMVLPGTDFDVSIEDADTTGTSGEFYWTQDGKRVFADKATTHTFTADADLLETVITVTTPGGFAREIKVLIAHEIGEPQLVNASVDVGSILEISVTVDGVEYINDPAVLKQLTIPAASQDKLAVEDGVIKAIGIGRGVVSITTLSGVTRTRLVSVSDLHTHRTEHAAVDATCTTDGSVAYFTCDYCGKAFDAEDHELEENSWVVPAYAHEGMTCTEGTPATCDEPGTIDTYLCPLCGLTFDADGNELEPGSEVIPAYAHSSTVWIEPTEPTCADFGNTGYYACAYCNEVFFDENHEIIEPYSWEIPATRMHHFKDDACTVCGMTFDLSELAVLQLPDDTTEIAAEAFMGTGIEAVIIPDGCTSIGSLAFADCDSLFIVVIPGSVTTIAGNAFSGSFPEFIYR